MNNTALSYKKVAKKYNIPLEIITPIPGNDLFLEACAEGRAVEFISSKFRNGSKVKLQTAHL